MTSGQAPLVVSEPRLRALTFDVGLAVFGLVWMIRIFRSPRDEPPSWRYRDR